METKTSKGKEIRIPGPDHPITISPAEGRVRVTVAGRIVAESARALRLEEKGYPPVYYLPRDDADMSLLVRTKHYTYCPYKGDCTYYSIPIGGSKSEYAVWTYEKPYEAVANIKEYLAFYPSRVDAIEVYATDRSLLSSTAGVGQRPHVFWKLLPFAVVIGGAPIWEEARARPRLRRISMSDQRGVVSADHYRPDPYTQSRIAERTLNAAIVHAEIARSYEEYLVIFDAFYADDVEGSSETTEEPIRGKAGVRSLVFGFLVPLHAMAEVGAVSISVRQTPIPGDVVDETHSAWTLELVGATGKVCTVSWRTFRKWSDSRVVLEHHYDHQQSGEPLSDGDLRLNVLEPPTSFHKSS